MEKTWKENRDSSQMAQKKSRQSLYYLSDSFHAHKQAEEKNEEGEEREDRHHVEQNEQGEQEERKGVEQEQYHNDWDLFNSLSHTSLEKDKNSKQIRLTSKMRNVGGEKAGKASEKSLNAVNRRRYRSIVAWGRMEDDDVVRLDFKLDTQINSVVNCLKKLAQDSENPLCKRYSFLNVEEEQAQRKLMLQRVAEERNPAVQRELQAELNLVKAAADKKMARQIEFRQKLAWELQDLKQARPEYQEWIRMVLNQAAPEAEAENPDEEGSEDDSNPNNTVLNQN